MSQIHAERTQTNVPLYLSVTRTGAGGVAGLTAVVAIRDGQSTTSYLDWSDQTFKTSGWTTREAAMADLGGGFYARAGGLNLSTITNLPGTTTHLVAEYRVSGIYAGVSTDHILLATTVYAPATSAQATDIQARLPATLSGGRMRAQVEGMDAGTVTASAVATDAIDGDALAASAVSEIQAGLATAAALALVQADTDDIQARLPATLLGGRMRAHVEDLDPGTITSSEAPALANLDVAVSSRAIPGDAMALTVLARDAVADAIWDEALAGHLVAGSTGKALDDAKDAADASSIATAVLGASVSGHPVGSLGDVVQLLRRMARNRLEEAPGSPGTLILYADDGITPLITWTLTDFQGNATLGQVGVPSRRTAGAP
jgi:hypothetical protein